jgi:hypothetical protein
MQTTIASKLGITGAAFVTFLFMPLAGNAQGTAPAQPRTAPVALDDCRILNNRNFVAPYGALKLGFSNHAPIQADEVDFTIAYAGRTAHVRDAGSFEPNVAIRHSFEAFRDVLYRGPAPTSCFVDHVRFHDGTAWPPNGSL